MPPQTLSSLLPATVSTQELPQTLTPKPMHMGGSGTPGVSLVGEAHFPPGLLRVVSLTPTAWDLENGYAYQPGRQPCGQGIARTLQQHLLLSCS